MREVEIEWRLRQVMAQRGMFSTTDLQPLLVERGGEPVGDAGVPSASSAVDGSARIERPEGLVCPQCWEWVQLAGVGVPRPQKKRPRPPRRTCDRCRKVKQIATRRTREDVRRSCANHPQALCAQCGHPRAIRRGVKTLACPRCA